MEQSPQVSSGSQALAELRHTHSSFSSCRTPNTTCQFAGLSKLQNFPSFPLTRQCCCSPASLSAVSTPPLPQHPSNHLVSCPPFLYVTYLREVMSSDPRRQTLLCSAAVINNIKHELSHWSDTVVMMSAKWTLQELFIEQNQQHHRFSLRCSSLTAVPQCDCLNLHFDCHHGMWVTALGQCAMITAGTHAQHPFFCLIRLVTKGQIHAHFYLMHKEWWELEISRAGSVQPSFGKSESFHSQCRKSSF